MTSGTIEVRTAVCWRLHSATNPIPDLPMTEQDWALINPQSATSRLRFPPGYYGRLDKDEWFRTISTQLEPMARQCQVTHYEVCWFQRCEDATSMLTSTRSPSVVASTLCASSRAHRASQTGSYSSHTTVSSKPYVLTCLDQRVFTQTDLSP